MEMHFPFLKKFSSNFVDMVMTSPPYWDLRNYGVSAYMIWDRDPECRYEWVESKIYYSKPHYGIGSKTMAISSVTMDALKSKDNVSHGKETWKKVHRN